jgi:hypothetical protein
VDFSSQKAWVNILNQNLNLSKQNRWLWKNNLLSDQLVTKSASWTALKKLTGNQSWDENTSNLNIWFSNKLSNDLNYKKLNSSLTSSMPNFKTLKNSNLLLNTMFNFNTYETSIFWVAKRYKFLQNLGTNVHYRNFNNTNQNTMSQERFEISKHKLVTNSVIFNYTFSQVGLIASSKTESIYRRLNNNNIIFSSLNQNLTSTLLFSANKDILSSMDAEFITYLTSDVLIKNNYLTFFSNIV